MFMILLQILYVANGLNTPLDNPLLPIKILLIQIHGQINYTNIQTCVQLINCQLKKTQCMV